MNTAVILAAGLGTRFGERTELIPKGFIEVGGASMVVRSIETLLTCGIQRILIGPGYKREEYEKLQAVYPAIETCFSPRYAETNSMYTLYNMRHLIGEDDFLLLESDLIFERKAIDVLLACKQKDEMLIASLTKFQDEYYIEASSGLLTNCSTDKSDLHHVDGELVGIHKLSNAFYQKMCDDYSFIVSEQPKLGYEYELLRMSRLIMPMHVLKEENLKWYEIDDEADLAYAEAHIVSYC
jgi:2-aminoethylphosphonate-pyruvate transaminase